MEHKFKFQLLVAVTADNVVQEDEMLKQLQFFSVASDGRVTMWTLAKSELLHQVLLPQHMPGIVVLLHCQTCIQQTCRET